MVVVRRVAFREDASHYKYDAQVPLSTTLMIIVAGRHVISQKSHAISSAHSDKSTKHGACSEHHIVIIQSTHAPNLLPLIQS